MIGLLPQELQCIVIGELDPVSLISLSQTNGHFRRLIQPQRRHLIERLLALELDPYHGGPTFSFRARSNGLVPNLTDEDWGTIRWACSGCLKLLSSKHFDNHSVLKLKYRKPPPSSPASVFDSWRPGNTKYVAKTAHASRRVAEELFHQERKKMMARYHFCVTTPVGLLNSMAFEGLQERDLVGLQDMRSAEWAEMSRSGKLMVLDENARLIELETCGFKRHKRRCNECRFQANDLKPNRNSQRGSPLVPIVPGRQRVYGSPIDRFFPKVSDFMDCTRPSSDYHVYRTQQGGMVQGELWSLWMVRCIKCRQWTELREFRIGLPYHRYHIPPVEEKLGERVKEDEWIYSEWHEWTITSDRLERGCNACLARTHGAEELGRQLAQRLRNIAQPQLLALNQSLRGGFFHDWVRVGRRAPPKFRQESRHLLSFLKGSERVYQVSFTYQQVALMRHRIQQMGNLWEAMKKEGDTSWAHDGADTWYQGWVESFAEEELHWRWTMSCIQESMEKPEAMAAWALSRDDGVVWEE